MHYFALALKLGPNQVIDSWDLLLCLLVYVFFSCCWFVLFVFFVVVVVAFVAVVFIDFVAHVVVVIVIVVIVFFWPLYPDILELKGDKSEIFSLCMMFKKVISFIYETIYFGDRVPLSLRIEDDFVFPLSQEE